MKEFVISVGGSPTISETYLDLPNYIVCYEQLFQLEESAEFSLKHFIIMKALIAENTLYTRINSNFSLPLIVMNH